MDAAEETRKNISIVVGRGTRATCAPRKGHRRRDPRAKPGNRKAQKKPNQRKQRAGRACGPVSGEHAVEMARRRVRADKAAMRTTRLLLVTASPPAHRLRSSTRTRYAVRTSRDLPRQSPLTNRCSAVPANALGLGAMHVA